MKKMFAICVTCLVLATPLFAEKKEAERLANSAKVLREIIAGGLPASIIDKADCVLIFPGVKKAAIGVGATYGRGALVCRKGANMNGAWGAPAMYSLNAGSLGLQLGSTATDYVLVVMKQKGVDQILNGKTKLGANAAAAAGPTGAQATTYDANAMNVDVLTYSQSKGLFAGVSLEGASIESDKDDNKALYGKDLDAKEIVGGSVAVVPAAQPLVSLLDQTSPVRK